MFGGLFGKKKTPEQMMREYKRSLDKTVRELERERVKMQNQEKKLITDMKKLAKSNQMDAVKIMAKDLVRTRQQCTKFYKMKAQMQAVSLRLQTLQSTAQMSKAMAGATKAMRGMNAQMNMPQMQRIMMEFERQNEMMGMKEEMMNDAIDDVMDDGDEEEDADALVTSVMDEIGLDLKGQIDIKDGALGNAQAGAAKEEDDDLQARLDKLRKS